MLAKMSSIPSRLLRTVAGRRATNSLITKSSRPHGAAAAAAAATTSNNILRTMSSRLAFSTGGALLTEMAKENPYKDVVRYEHKNRKWSLQHVDFYSEALACGLLENGLQPGDVVLSWLPQHFSESVSSDLL